MITTDFSPAVNFLPAIHALYFLVPPAKIQTSCERTTDTFT